MNPHPLVHCSESLTQWLDGLPHIRDNQRERQVALLAFVAGYGARIDIERELLERSEGEL